MLSGFICLTQALAETEEVFKHANALSSHILPNGTAHRASLPVVEAVALVDVELIVSAPIGMHPPSLVSSRFTCTTCVNLPEMSALTQVEVAFQANPV